MKKYKRNILRWLYREFDTDGKFKVHYSSGEITKPMRHSGALAYALIFGGKIIDNF